jgi:hypothetical protein
MARNPEYRYPLVPGHFTGFWSYLTFWSEAEPTTGPVVVLGVPLASSTRYWSYWMVAPQYVRMAWLADDGCVTTTDSTSHGRSHFADERADALCRCSLLSVVLQFHRRPLLPPSPAAAVCASNTLPPPPSIIQPLHPYILLALLPHM